MLEVHSYAGKKEERKDRERNALKGHCAELDLDFKRGESLS